jgi:hypothetical protein
MKNKIKKKAIELEMLGWWIIGLAVLVLIIIGIVILKGKGFAALDYIKNLFRFGK